MDLIDRYLTAIRWNLPRGVNADDVIAELRDVIASRVEDREESLGRPLDEKEISALLREFGHPLVVAARYGTQQSLIGPDLFPFYWFSLKVVLAICAAVMVVTGVINAISGGHSIVRALVHVLTSGWWSLLANAGLVTLIFVVLERTGWLTEYLEQWSPEELPDLKDFKVKPQSAWESVFQVAVGIAFILWWVGLIHVPLAYTDVEGLTLTPAPVWTDLWVPILALMVARLVFNLIQWLRPRWKLARAVLSVATAAGGLALLALIYQAGHWLTATSATMPADQLADIDRSTNLGIHYAIIVIGVIWALQCAKELWRLYAGRR
ncbi:hypothetical protein [Sphingomonas bacterium]|uniref:hypothetical protein n=1 Tax=Sphingomonas bacterium TaxID=1895847 RepID=UPI0026309F88|nr:hypothetical protein [Sphingomonas bacterium]MDB5679917.1 hypothetical protein [Sphingomonas bacterium]